MNKLEFCKKYKLTENQFCGKELIPGSLDLSSLTTIPKGFNPVVGENLNLYSLTSIPEGFNPVVGGNLILNSLKTIPKGFNPVVGGYLSLSSLKTIPEGFNPVVGGNLYLDSLESIPKGFNPVVGGSLSLYSLETFPEGFNPVVYGSLYLRSLKTIPNDFNPLCFEIYSDINIPFRKIPKNYIFSWQNGKYIKINNIFLEVLIINNNIYKCKTLNNEIIYLAKDGNIYAFGETEEKAEENLQYEIIKSII